MIKDLNYIYRKLRTLSFYSLFVAIMGCETRLIEPDNIPPYTKIIRPNNNQIFNSDSVKVEWNGHDIDGNVIGYYYRLDNTINIYPPASVIIISDYTRDTTKTFYNLENGYYRFEIRAQDNYGDYDPTPDVVDFLVDK